jgi:hypothetical protein
VDKRNQLVKLVDEAISIAESALREKATKKDSYGMAVSNLKELRENILNGKIGASNGATLGLSKNIGEVDNGSLADIAWKIDKFFSEKM